MPKLPSEPKEGEVWDIQFGATVGVEQAGVRPAVVMSNDWFNRTENNLFIVAPITGTDRSISSQVRIGRREGGLSKTSVIMCEQVRAVDARRFLSKRGVVSMDTLNRVRRIVSLSVDELPMHPDNAD